MASKGKWTKLNVTHGTAARLRRLAEKMADAIASGRVVRDCDPDPINPRACAVSADRLINWLLDEWEEHRARAERQRVRRKAAVCRKRRGTGPAREVDGKDLVVPAVDYADLVGDAE